MDAAGCKDAVGNIENSKVFFKDGYQILKDNAHCRPRVCNRPAMTYVPDGAMSDCKSSYFFCGKEIDIRTSSNSDIVTACNTGMSPSELPSWWGKEDDDDQWWLDDGRRFPFTVFPFNQLPIKAFPKKFDWEDDDVQYLTYASVATCSICCCCILMLIMVMR
jgi:hypothetical protein